MGWTANVTNKEALKDQVVVTVEYTDGVRTISETYKSASPTADWIPNTVALRIAQLAVLDNYSIPIGSVTPIEPGIMEAEAELFRRRIRALRDVKILIDLGIVKADNAKVLALAEWFKNNISTYFDLLG